MATPLKSLKTTAASHWSRQQQRSHQRQIDGVGASLKQQSARTEMTKGLGEMVAGWITTAADALYGKLAETHDTHHLLALRGEIDARFAKGAQGVLLQRVTQRKPDSAGNFLPQYVGMLVVGEGSTEAEARLELDRRRQAEQPRDAPLAKVCTSLNPTGEPRKAQASLRPAPEGYNMGYAASLSAKLMDALAQNPGNVGKISFGDLASPIQPRSYLEFDLVFVTRERWQAVKDSQQR
ncbi:hypothetical protein MW290_02255 [Aquincola tertiaricarbonis]|uniref:Uncharacterized protein n=1 Tax=Aquincola tertiaricarbonis TaxID=391953 RepID=A0ABY4S4U4_AQUTE|nr:hypothetical protein [Aquincola tertiaricarbonis]URI07464.1 hypothetical protein MW290_02255 [Aquincola tertiaricarbonis]